jgi:hypothetical protein
MERDHTKAEGGKLEDLKKHSHLSVPLLIRCLEAHGLIVNYVPYQNDFIVSMNGKEHFYNLERHSTSFILKSLNIAL